MTIDRRLWDENGGLERPLHFFHAVALDDVADAHVLVVLEGHAAFLARRDLADVVLEALELATACLRGSPRCRGSGGHWRRAGPRRR